MTSQEIKEAYSMRDIVERYGFHPNRMGFIPCPFHTGDHQASLKVYDRDFYCHACGTHGDIFTFVQMMENIPFKEVFIELGGEYEKDSFASYLRINREKQRKNRIRQIMASKKEERKRVCMMVEAYRGILQEDEPFSDLWCHCMNGLQYQLYILDNIETG